MQTNRTTKHSRCVFPMSFVTCEQAVVSEGDTGNEFYIIQVPPPCTSREYKHHSANNQQSCDMVFAPRETLGKLIFLLTFAYAPIVYQTTNIQTIFLLYVFATKTRAKTNLRGVFWLCAHSFIYIIHSMARPWSARPARATLAF